MPTGAAASPGERPEQQQQHDQRQQQQQEGEEPGEPAAPRCQPGSAAEDEQPEETSKLLQLLRRRSSDMQAHAEEAAERKPAGKPVLSFNFSKLSFVDKARFVWDNITVEPMLGAYMFSWMLAIMATQNLNLEKSCRVNLNYSMEVCDALTRRDTANYTFEQEQVLKLTASMTGWKMFLQTCPLAITSLFVGSWSDRHGRRKPCMILPIVGELITNVGLLICTFFFYELPVEAAVFTEAVFPAICGGWVTMFTGVFSYIADVTSEETRTVRIGIVNMFYSLGLPIGLALSGVLYKLIGFYGVFSLAGCLQMCGLWYGYKYVKESPIRKKESDTVGFLPFLKDFFNLGVVLETFRGSFVNRHRTIRVLVILFVVLMLMIPMGEHHVTYLYFRQRFNFGEIQYSMFVSYSMFVHLTGSSIAMGVLSHKLKMDDAFIGILSCMTKIFASFLYAFATAVWMIYLAPLVDMVNGMSLIAVRSITSKLVPPDDIGVPKSEAHSLAINARTRAMINTLGITVYVVTSTLGKVNALVGVCEAMVPLVSAPLYTGIYMSTMHTLPGAFFLAGGAFTAPPILGFVCLYRFMKMERKARAKETSKKEEFEKGVHDSSKKI